MLIINPIKSNNTNKTKEPDFGFLLEDAQGFIRATYVVLEDLCKIPDINCVPTIVTLGVDFDESTLRKIIIKLKDCGLDNEKIIEQIVALKTLLNHKHRVSLATLNRFPFCRIRLLNETQLNDINTVCGINLEYETYKIAIPILLDPENLKDIYTQLGVITMPKINLNDSTEKTDTNFMQIRALIEQTK